MPDPINAGAIPGANLDPDMVDISANQMRLIGTDVGTQGATVLTSWQQISGCYEAPEADTLFAVMDPVKTNAETFGTNLGTVATALNTFADAIRPIKAELAAITTDAYSFLDGIKGGVDKMRPAGRAGMVKQHMEWHEDQDSVDANNKLIERVNAQVVKLWAAERACANSIYDVIGYAHVEAASEGNPNGYGVDEIPEGTKMPWGSEVERTESCGEKAAGAVGRFVWDGICVNGIWGTVKGLGTLVLGYNPNTGDWFSGDAYGTAWGNLGMMAVGSFATSPVGLPLSTMPGPVGDFLRKGQQSLLAAGKSMIAWDKWSEDPATAAGETVFNVGTILIPAGAAVSGVKAGGGAAAAAMRTAAKIADVADPASAAVKLAGAGAKAVVPALTDLAKAMKLPGFGDLGDLGKVTDVPGVVIKDGDYAFPNVGKDGTSLDLPNHGVDNKIVIHDPRHVDVSAPVREPVTVGGGSGHGHSGGSGLDGPSTVDHQTVGHQTTDHQTVGHDTTTHQTIDHQTTGGHGGTSDGPSPDGQPGGDHGAGDHGAGDHGAGDHEAGDHGAGDHGAGPGKVDVPPAYEDLPRHDLDSGGKGDWNKALHHPDANSVYVVDDRHVYVTDDSGRVVHVDSQLDLGPADRNGYQQGIAGGPDRLQFDQGGHLIAAQFGGPGEGINLVAMSKELNGSGLDNWYAMEKDWADVLKAHPDADIRVKIDVSYPDGSARPDGFQVQYSIDGGPTVTKEFDQ